MGCVCVGGQGDMPLESGSGNPVLGFGERGCRTAADGGGGNGGAEPCILVVSADISFCLFPHPLNRIIVAIYLGCFLRAECNWPPLFIDRIETKGDRLSNGKTTPPS